jgi:hypothetical protein
MNKDQVNIRVEGDERGGGQEVCVCVGGQWGGGSNRAGLLGLVVDPYHDHRGVTSAKNYCGRIGICGAERERLMTRGGAEGGSVKAGPGRRPLCPGLLWWGCKVVLVGNEANN